MTTVDPSSEPPVGLASQSPLASAACASPILRTRASRNMTASSATPSALPDSSPGILAAQTPSLLAASRSTFSRPTPNCCTRPNWPASRTVRSMTAPTGQITSTPSR
ncbi:MAG TPA: hypothetical protein VMA95_01435 [Streptosporangiaceae bacterium]|nr:hypothetical protein [Streptosporangiaceae bacterium]